jgi:hypothetical protein
VGGTLVAVTEAGHILAFGTEPFELLREKLNLHEAWCLGAPTDRHVLVGFSDGLIARMFVPSLDVEPVTRVPGRPLWIGPLPLSGELAVAYAQPTDSKPRYRYYERLAKHTVRFLPSGLEVRVKEPATYFIDDQDRLWLGSNRGEWGGGVQVVEPGSDQARDVVMPDRYDAKNVRGFLEVGREVWAFGGLSHLLSTDAFITRVSPARPARILHHAHRVWVRGRPKPPRSPDTPISHIAKLGNQLLVFAVDHVFETDAKLERWKRRSKLDLHYLPGSPAVGVHPVIPSIHVLGFKLFAATRRSGFIEIGGNSVVPHTLPRELPVAAHSVFAASDEIVVAGSGEEWVVLGPEGDWTLARDRLLPPLSTDDGEKPTWCDMRFFPRADGGLRIVAKSGEIDGGFGCMDTHAEGTLIDGVRRDGRFTERARVSSTLAPDHMFELSDGRIAATDREYALWTFDAGKLSKIAENWVWHIGDNLGSYGDGWIARTHGGLALVRTPPSPKQLFTPLALTLDGIQPELLQAVRTSTTSLLATSERGLLAYDIPTGVATLLEPKGLSGRPTWIGVDARGRIWLAGDGAFLFVPPDRVEPVANVLPLLGHVTVESVALNGSRLILALGPRGLLVLDTDEIAKLLLRPAPQSGSQAHQLRQVVPHRLARATADAE